MDWTGELCPQEDAVVGPIELGPDVPSEALDFVFSSIATAQLDSTVARIGRGRFANQDRVASFASAVCSLAKASADADHPTE